jgi:hypothetical protein
MQDGYIGKSMTARDDDGVDSSVGVLRLVSPETGMSALGSQDEEIDMFLWYVLEYIALLFVS